MNALLNEDLLKFKEVRLVGDNIENGIYLTTSALSLAEGMELDLVCVSMTTSPPVCRITSYEKMVYQQKKRQKEQSKNKTEVKEIRFTPTIGEHDYGFKLKHAQEFLKKGNKVKALVFFSGRELNYKKQGEEVLQRFISDLSDISKIDSQMKMEGRRMFVILSPK